MEGKRKDKGRRTYASSERTIAERMRSHNRKLKALEKNYREEREGMEGPVATGRAQRPLALNEIYG